MWNKEILRLKIQETRNKAGCLIIANMFMEIACDKGKEITKEWALKAEEMLDDIARKYEEYYKYCNDFYGEALEENCNEKMKDINKP